MTRFWPAGGERQIRIQQLLRYWHVGRQYDFSRLQIAHRSQYRHNQSPLPWQRKKGGEGKGSKKKTAVKTAGQSKRPKHKKTKTQRKYIQK